MSEQDPLARIGQGNAYDAQFGQRIDAIGGRSAKNAGRRSGSGGGGGTSSGGWIAGVVIAVVLAIIRVASNTSRTDKDPYYQPRYDREMDNFRRTQDDWNARQREQQQQFERIRRENAERVRFVDDPGLPELPRGIPPPRELP